MGGGNLEADEDERQQPDDEEPVEYSKLLVWLKSNDLESCFTYFVTNGLKDCPPSCRALYVLKRDSKYLTNIKLGTRTRLQRLALDESLFWSLVPSKHRRKVFEKFESHELIDEADIAELNEHDLREVLRDLDGDVIAKMEEVMKNVRGGATANATWQGPAVLDGMPCSALENAMVAVQHPGNAFSVGIEKTAAPATVVSEKTGKAERLSDTLWSIVTALGARREVYKLMELYLDHQNGSLVDKFVLPRAEVARFGNAASPNSVSPTASKINFSKLDGTTQTCYGVFGQRRSLLLFLQKLGFTKDKLDFNDGITMEEPGLYAYVASPLPQGLDPHVQLQADSKQPPKQTVFLVVWPQDDAFVTIQAKSKTTTFLRYLTQLCCKIFVCLDEVSANTFPTERKPRMLDRRHKYKILQEVSQEEQFVLLPGFSVPYNGRAEAFKVVRLVEGTGGAAVLFGQLCPLKGHFMPYLRNINLSQASDELQELTQLYNVELNMSQEGQIVFFRNFSQNCRQIVDQLDEKISIITVAKEESVFAGWLEIESNKHFKKSLEMLMLKELQRLISPRWLELGQALMMEEEVEIYPECLGHSVRRRVSLSVEDWRICEKLALCCAVFLLPDSPEISPSAVEDCFDHFFNPRGGFFGFITGLFNGSKFKGGTNTDPRRVEERMKRLIGSSDWTDFLLQDAFKSSMLLADLKRCLVRKVKSRVESLTAHGPLSTNERKQALKAQQDRKAESEYQCLVSDALKELRGLVFPRPGEEASDKPCLNLQACRLWKSELQLQGQHEVPEEGKVRYTVHLQGLSQEDEDILQHYPHARFQPRLGSFGSFHLPLASSIVAAQLIKDKVVVVCNNTSDRRATVSLFNLSQATGGLHKKLGRDVKLAAIDGQSRLVALYIFEVVNDGPAMSSTGEDGGTAMSSTGEDGGMDYEVQPRNIVQSEVVVYRFDESFQRLEQACKGCELHHFSGESELQALVFLQGCQQLALLDVGNRIRIYDIRQQCLLTQPDGGRQLDRSLKVHGMFSTGKGKCLLALAKEKDGSELQAFPFMSPSYTGMAPSRVDGSDGHQWAAVALGNHRKQDHLCALDPETGDLSSYIIVASGKEQSQVITSASDQGSQHNSENLHLTPLEYIYYVYDKFPVQATIRNQLAVTELQLSVIFHCEQKVFVDMDLQSRVKNYLTSVDSLLRDTMKPVDSLTLLENLQVSHFSNEQPYGHNDKLAAIMDEEALPGLQIGAVAPEALGEWLRRLICLVPIQVARAEDNSFLVLSDGVLVPQEQARSVQECAENIKLGLQGTILDWWMGPVIAISSMGKQSTGKSYTLNHLFGLSFEISGARCTDGCWMTLSEVDGVLYVILDFEGLGSFERTDQEDMLLSVFNSALSGLTIFKTEYRLDRDIEQMFARFQAGVGLIKGDDRLFKGHLCITIKDVAFRDIESVEKEFRTKIEQITAADSSVDVGENFITKMYNGEFTILPFPALGERAYYSELNSIKQELKGRPTHFHNGSSFADCMKNLMAKMQLKDWRSLARQEIEARLRYLEMHLETALHHGLAEVDNGLGKEDLASLDTGDVIPDSGLAAYLPEGHPLTQVDISLMDADVVYPQGGGSDHDFHMSLLLEKYESFGLVRTGESPGEWFRHFQQFCEALVHRRAARVMEWVKRNLAPFQGTVQEDVSEEGKEPMDAEAAKFMDDTALLTRKLEHEWQICRSSCSKCYLNCLSARDHEGEVHSCMGNHECSQQCQYCQEEGEESVCGEKMGHPGCHDCRIKDHTCSQPCDLSACLGCNGTCAKKTDHNQGPSTNQEHRCSAAVHLCGQPCSAFGCSGKCQIIYGKGHTVHKCVDAMCTHKCAVLGCNQTCSARDHFHGSAISATFRQENNVTSTTDLQEYNGLHFCGQAHACPKLCESEGICRVSIGLKQEGVEEFTGKRGSFTFRTVSEANGEQEVCRIKIPPFKLKHEGLHRHSTDPAVVHYCDYRCPTCLYFCEQAHGHEGPHSAAHGMMRKCHFVSDQQDIDIGQRKYVVGESGRAEMCDMFCRELGRGHIHIMQCDATLGQCTHAAKDGRRHETCKYSPDPSVPKDELTHGCYWATIGWKDPCATAEKKVFNLCGAACSHQGHLETGAEESYCTLPLWHPPATKDLAQNSHGYVSMDGHLFNCVHHDYKDNVHHVVMVLDGSGSMSGAPWTDLMAAVDAFVQDRKTKKSPDLLSIIVYSNNATVYCEATPILSSRSFHPSPPMQGTSFSAGLKEAYEVLKRHQGKHLQYQPLLLFLSDGQCSDGHAEMSVVCRDFQAQNLQVYTVGFGSDADNKRLRDLAMHGKGQHLHSMTGLDLKDTFLQVSAKMSQKISLVATPGANSQGSESRVLGQGSCPPIMSRSDTRVHKHRITTEEARAEAEEYAKAREKAAIEVAKLMSKSKDLGEFLIALGFQGKQSLETARKLALQKYHPDKTQGGSVEERAFGEEVIKIITGWSAE